MNINMTKIAGLVDKELGVADEKFLHRMAQEDDAVGQELKTQESVGKWLKETGRPYQCDASPDFFWSQVSRQIEAEEARGKTRFSQETLSGFFRAFWAPALAVAVIVCVVFFQPAFRGGIHYADVIEAKTSLQRVSVTPFQSEKSKVTVIWIEGLDYLPANPNILQESS